MKVAEFFKTKIFKTILITLGALVVLLIVFQAGMYVGYRKANFAFRWAASYHRNFGGPQNGFLDNFEGKDFVNGHGVAGTIVKIDGPTIIIKGLRDVEKIVTASDATTTIKKGTDTIKISDLKTDDLIVVIGTPKDDGSVEARLIRVFDPKGDASPRPLMRRFGF